MLGREAARRALADYAAPRRSRRPDRGPHRQIGGWGPRLRRLADDPWGHPGAARVGAELDACSHPERVAAFAEACPALAEALAQWWAWAPSTPYQRGWEARAYRSSDPADSRVGRVQRLAHLLDLGQRWPQDVRWFAGWLSHLDDDGGVLGGLLAAAVDAGDDVVVETLVQSMRGTHPVSGATRAGIAALLASGRPDLRSHVTDVLRSAGRQEGIRTAVLEAVDLAHPDSFRAVLQVVLDEDLLRFAGTVRAVGVWFGEDVDVRTTAEVPAALAELAAALADPTRARATGTPVETFVRLTALAHRDAREAIPAAARLLADGDAGIRRAAARLLAELGLPAARDALTPALADPDLGVYATAVSAWPARLGARDGDAQLDDAAIGALTERIRQLGKPRSVETGLVGSRVVKVSAAHAADVVLSHRTVTAAPAEALAAASPDGRWQAAHQLAEDPVTNRAALFGLIGDGSSMVRSLVFAGLEQLEGISAAEAALLEAALRRKAADVRRTALTLLLRQPTPAVRASVAALAAGTAEQVAAAAELATRAGVPGPASTSSDVDHPAAALFAGLGARTPSRRPDAAPADRFVRYHAGCRRVLASLQEWLAERADTEVVHPAGGVTLLADVFWIPQPAPGELPLHEVLGPWWEDTEPALTDGGVEVALLAVGWARSSTPYARQASATVVGPLPPDLGAPDVLRSLVDHLARALFRPSWVDTVLDAATSLRADLPLDQLLGPAESMARLGRTMRYQSWGAERGEDARSAFLDPAASFPLEGWTPEQIGRAWRLARFVDEPAGAVDQLSGPTVRHTVSHGYGPSREVEVPDQPWRRRPGTELLCRAVDAGYAGRADLVDALMPDHAWSPTIHEHQEWPGTPEQLSARRPPAWASSEPIRTVVEEVRDAVVAGEVARGDLPGPLSGTAVRWRSSTGVPRVVGCLRALGRRPFVRGYAWGDDRESSLSRLVRIHVPTPTDTADQLSAELTSAGITERRVVEFAVYAPQWAALVETHLGWPGFADAVWWIHAHTKDDQWVPDEQIREEWAAAVAQRTPLDTVDLVRGAADVAWFHRVVDQLGEDRFAQVFAAGRYASSSGGHKRAELFADAMSGRLTEEELVERIRGKRHQDSVRALGLLPLSGPDDPALLRRYELLQAFVGSDRTSGAQRRASESTAVAIGLENLARAAGHRDPGRLTWAMEAEAVRDLAAGPRTVVQGDLAVTLALSADGSPRLDVRRGERALKAVPAPAKKVPAIAELVARVGELRQQATRMRRSLEASCTTGAPFDRDEYAGLVRHPLLAPMLRDLVLVSEEGVAGFATDHPAVVLGPGGEERPLDGSRLRVAHPVDLLAGHEWPEFQHDVVAARRRQPFKQLFRELYLPTAVEVDDGSRVSRRYAGQQVEGHRARGILGGRGWVGDPDDGFSRTFHDEKITVWCTGLHAFGTAVDVEDAALDEVLFVPTGTWDAVPIAEVPPRLFSEAMRDLDLVVSVAHAGGVDPETSASTVEMRRRLVEETADLLGLAGVETTDHHVRIRGTLGDYSVHLGSGTVHRQPGGALCIVPVGAQHRGRVFLPFVDDDPRTAEVISKVLLLARDDRIQDPTVLEQLTR